MEQEPDDVYEVVVNGMKISIIPSVDLIRGVILEQGEKEFTLDRYIQRSTVSFIPLSTERICVNSYDVEGVHFCQRGYSGYVPGGSGYYLDYCDNPRRADGVSCPRYSARSEGLPGELGREVEFIDGDEELKRYGDYSIDYVEGILYLWSTFKTNLGITYSYGRFTATYLANMPLNITCQVSGSSISIKGIDGLTLQGKGINEVAFIYTAIPTTIPWNQIPLTAPSEFRVDLV